MKVNGEVPNWRKIKRLERLNFTAMIDFVPLTITFYDLETGTINEKPVKFQAEHFSYYVEDLVEKNIKAMEEQKGTLILKIVLTSTGKVLFEWAA